ncbi:hypothetical protein WAF17_09395 [Bernardetia sp. ABR2-2B]|uniref:hypothetical protein n=1 Tax=Bernardetia sp. ABR2-2B TaxID=3127472 RepID=UPI0030D2F6E4
MQRTLFLYFFVVLCYSPRILKAQTSHTTDSTHLTQNKTEQKSFVKKITDLLAFQNKAEKTQDSIRFRSKLVLSPGLTYSPVTSWGVGTGINWNFRFKNISSSTRTSNAGNMIAYTLRNQFIIGSRYTIFTNHENYMIRGNSRYSKFLQSYFGIGISSRKEDEEIIDYQNIRSSNILYKKIFGQFFLGVGFRYRNIWNIKYNKEGLIDMEKPFGYKGSVAIGWQLGAILDSRDNILNCFKGVFYNFRYVNHQKIGGSIPFRTLQMDMRHYFKLSERNDILAFQAFGIFNSQTTPLLELAPLGGNELMRGYIQGRFIDNNVIATQAEYRFPILEPIGMVIFGSIGQVYNSVSELNLSNLKTGYGAGIRFQLSKAERLNLRFDIAKGDNLNFYFGVAEAF